MRTNTVLIRLVFIGILIGAGFVLDPIGAKYAAQPANAPFGLPTHVFSALLALVIAVAIILFEIRIQRASLKTLIGAGVGSIMGIVGGVLIGFLISYQEPGAVNPSTKAFLTLALAFIMAYVGLMVGAAWTGSTACSRTPRSTSRSLTRTSPPSRRLTSSSSNSRSRSTALSSPTTSTSTRWRSSTASRC